jgi:hypothetical protein
MTDRTRKGSTMKRTATILGVLTAFAVAPAVAAAGNESQVAKTAVVKSALVESAIVKPAPVKPAPVRSQVVPQRAEAHRFSFLLRAHVR